MKKNCTILIVEDDLILREAYELILKSKNYKVKTAENGKVGLQHLATFNPDLILLDLLMPILDGKEFLVRAAVKTNRPNIKIIVYSNVSNPEIIDEVLELGADKHILKSSMSPNDLVEEVDALLSD